MRVTFILPGSADAPVGGVKVVYEYANRLAARGHRLTVVHAPVTRIDPSPVMLGKAALRYPQRILDRSYRPDRWMQVDPSVRVRWVPSYAERFIPEADVVIATAWNTAEWVARYGDSKGSKCYLIQHYEEWDGGDRRVQATWKAPLHKVVIARWLQDIAARLGERATYIPNGLDFSKFGVDVPIANRASHTAFMLYHELAWKASADGLAAAHRVHAALSDFRLLLFGVPKSPADLPEWITYHRNPTQAVLRRLYNEASIFIAPSLAEGWPLPPAEAMMSGLALACTDIGGHREYANDGRSALLSQPGDPDALADNALRLCRDDALRHRIAEAGNGYIQQFTWDRAVDSFEAFLHAVKRTPSTARTGTIAVPSDGESRVGGRARSAKQ